MPGYPGRLYGQIYSRLVVRNDLVRGGLRLGDREIALADVRQRVLLVAGTDDAIAPVAAVRAGVHALTGAASVQLRTVPGSHLGIVAGPSARETTWQHVADFLRD
jgi:polyhydroxyalkanoate synthase